MVKKNLLIISQNYYPEIGSSANRMKNIKKLLTEKGLDVTVLTTDPNYPNRNLYQNENKGFRYNEEFEKNVIRVSTKVRRYTRNMFSRLLLYIEITIRFILILLRSEKKFDYLFVSSPPIFIGIAGLFAKKRFKIPLILDVRDLWPETLLGVGVFAHKPLLKIAYLLERKLYREADQIVINSEGFKKYITKKGIDPKKISFLPNSLTDNELALKNSKSGKPENISVIYTGNIGLAQDLEKFVDVAEKLKHRTDIHFKVIGYGYKSSEIASQIKDKQLDNFELLSPKNREETLQEVVKADIAYVSLAEKEVFESVLPGKVIDYMCLGKPIVGDVSGYCSEIIEIADCGLVSKSRDIDHLSEAIELLAIDHSLRKKLGNNGFRYAQDKFRWKKNINVLMDILEDFDEPEGMHVRMESFHE